MDEAFGGLRCIACDFTLNDTSTPHQSGTRSHGTTSGGPGDHIEDKPSYEHQADHRRRSSGSCSSSRRRHPRGGQRRPRPPHSGPAHRVAHAKPVAHARPADPLAGVRRGAGHAMDADTARVQRIAAAAATSTVVTSADKASLAAAESADLAALTADRAAIAAATTRQGIVAAREAGTRTASGAQLQVDLVVAADRTQIAAASLSAEAAAVTAAAAALPTGTDLSAVSTHLADLATQISTAVTDATTAATAALAVPAAPSLTQLRVVQKAARQDLAAAHGAIDAAAQGLAAAQDALTVLQTPPTSTPASTTTP